jgi:hypothetical protein
MRVHEGKDGGVGIEGRLMVAGGRDVVGAGEAREEGELGGGSMEAGREGDGLVVSFDRLGKATELAEEGRAGGEELETTYRIDPGETAGEPGMDLGARDVRGADLVLLPEEILEEGDRLEGLVLGEKRATEEGVRALEKEGLVPEALAEEIE